MFPEKSTNNLLSIFMLPSNLSILILSLMFPLIFRLDLKLFKSFFDIKSKFLLKSAMTSISKFLFSLRKNLRHL